MAKSGRDVKQRLFKIEKRNTGLKGVRMHRFLSKLVITVCFFWLRSTKEMRV